MLEGAERGSFVLAAVRWILLLLELTASSPLLLGYHLHTVYILLCNRYLHGCSPSAHHTVGAAERNAGKI